MSERVGVRLTERSIRIRISDDIGEAICFYNPYVRRFYCFQFGWVDRRFRIIRYLRSLCVCVTCTFKSGDRGRHWSKNLYVEAMVCDELRDTEYRDCRSPAEFYDMYLEVEREVSHRCSDCFDMFGTDYTVRGYELRVKRCYSYCCANRFEYVERRTEAGEVREVEEVVKTKCYDESYWSAPTKIVTNLAWATTEERPTEKGV